MKRVNKYIQITIIRKKIMKNIRVKNSQFGSLKGGATSELLARTGCKIRERVQQVTDRLQRVIQFKYNTNDEYFK